MKYQPSSAAAVVSIAISALLLSVPPVHAADASEVSGTGAHSMAVAPLGSLAGEPLEGSVYFVGGASLVVVGVGVMVDSSIQTVAVTVQNTANGSKAVLQASAAVARDVGLVAGNSIKVVAESTGHTLIASGKILAFVPNAAGKALLHQTRLSK